MYSLQTVLFLTEIVTKEVVGYPIENDHQFDLRLSFMTDFQVHYLSDIEIFR